MFFEVSFTYGRFNIASARKFNSALAAVRFAHLCRLLGLRFVELREWNTDTGTYKTIA